MNPFSARCSVLPQCPVFAACAMVMGLLSLKACNFKTTEPILFLFFSSTLALKILTTFQKEKNTSRIQQYTSSSSKKPL